MYAQTDLRVSRNRAVLGEKLCPALVVSEAKLSALCKTKLSEL